MGVAGAEHHVFAGDGGMSRHQGAHRSGERSRGKADHVASNERCHPFPVVYHKRLCPQIVIDTQKWVLPVPAVP